MTDLHPILYSQRLFLRGFTLEDAPDIALLMNDPVIADNGIGAEYPYPPDEAERFVKRTLKSVEKHHYNWGIFIKENDALIGSATLLVNQDYRHAQIGYLIGNDYRNQGYATEAARYVIDD